MDAHSGATIPAAGHMTEWSEPQVAAPARFFTFEERVMVNALCERLLALSPDCPVPVVARIEARLADQEPDGHFRGTCEDGTIWRLSLAALKADAVDRFQSPFAILDGDRRDRLILSVRDLGSKHWHEMPATRVWNLWTRYACTAFYSHPFAWNDLGFRV